MTKGWSKGMTEVGLGLNIGVAKARDLVGATSSSLEVENPVGVQ